MRRGWSHDIHTPTFMGTGIRWGGELSKNKTNHHKKANKKLIQEIVAHAFNPDTQDSQDSYRETLLEKGTKREQEKTTIIIRS